MTTLPDILESFLQDPQSPNGRREGMRLAERMAAALLLTPVSASLRAVENGLLVVGEKPGADQDHVLIGTRRQAAPSWLNAFSGEQAEYEGVRIVAAPCLAENVPALQAALPNLNPAPLGPAPSFGFGDRTGLATPGHAAAMQAHGESMTPIFAQQSIREMTRTERTARQVMADATWGAARAGWRGPVGADADHLKTRADIDCAAEAGFTFFTIDPSDYVDQQADGYNRTRLEERFENLLHAKVPGIADAVRLYSNRSFDLGSGKAALKEPALKRAAVKYGRALAHIYDLAGHTARVMQGRPFELEISVDETDQPTTVAEHLFIALELRRHGVPVVSLAPRFSGDFEKGVDYRGDTVRFKDELDVHAAIAEHYGPYKLSLHSGSDKFAVYPCFAKLKNRRFHVKTAGTSYLEALRTTCRTEPAFFAEIVAFSRGRFETDRATYHISAALENTPAADGLSPQALEQLYLNEDNGRQILHVTFGSVLTARRSGNTGAYRFRNRLQALLRQNRKLHEQMLTDHLGKHLRLLGGQEKR